MKEAVTDEEIQTQRQEIKTYREMYLSTRHVPQSGYGLTLH